MSSQTDSRWDRVLDQVHFHSRLIFGSLSLLIVLAGIGLGVAALVGESEEGVLPIEFRIVNPALSNRPVRIDHIRSCSCWHGPRDNAQRKYKFRVVNETDHIIDIDGGEHSVIRLLVAYPKGWKPRLVMPDPADHSRLQRMKSPPDVAIPISDKLKRFQVSRIYDDNAFFGVPSNYTLWALPAAPNKIAEKINRREVSYPTVVDKSELLPGEEYEGDRLGHGTWTFYVPLPHRFAQSLEFHGPAEMVLTHEYTDRHVMFVGVAALKIDSYGRVHLLGFAPAPSENALANPYEL
ncbi:MAG: hypothetical protein ACTHN7_00040 [Solirubrobacterales bacterium]